MEQFRITGNKATAEAVRREPVRFDKPCAFRVASDVFAHALLFSANDFASVGPRLLHYWLI
jgi:hypothetical protein